MPCAGRIERGRSAGSLPKGARSHLPPERRTPTFEAVAEGWRRRHRIPVDIALVASAASQQPEAEQHVCVQLLGRKPSSLCIAPRKAAVLGPRLAQQACAGAAHRTFQPLQHLLPKPPGSARKQRGHLPVMLARVGAQRCGAECPAVPCPARSPRGAPWSAGTSDFFIARAMTLSPT